MNYTVNFNALNKTPKFLIVSYLKGMILKWLQLFQGNVFLLFAFDRLVS